MAGPNQVEVGGLQRNMSIKDRLLGGGSVEDYLDGKARRLSSQSIVELEHPVMTATALVERLLPIFPAKVDRPEDYPMRVRKVVDTWVGNESEKRMYLYAVLALTSPIVSDTDTLLPRAELSRPNIAKDEYMAILKQAGMQMDRDNSACNLLGWIFTLDEHLLYLGACYESLADYKEKDITVVRRAIQGLKETVKLQIKGDRESEELKTDKLNILIRYAETTGLPVNVRRSIAEIILQTTSSINDDQVPSHIWWLALSSYEENTEGRVRDYLTHRLEESGESIVDSIVEEIRQTSADYDHRTIWWNLNKVISRLAKFDIGVQDKIFRALMVKIGLVLPANEYIYMGSVGPVCAALDNILHFSQNKDRRSEMIDRSEAQYLCDLLLKFYLQTKADANAWMYRAWIMNFVEALSDVYPEILQNEKLRASLQTADNQPEESFAPEEHTKGYSRLSEYEALRITISRIPEEQG